MITHPSKGAALITGASADIGAIYADRLARRGYDLILVARNEKRLSELSSAIRSGINEFGRCSKIEELESMIQLNVTALTRLTAAALPGFLARANGSIINIASIVAVAPELLNASTAAPRLMWSP